MEQWREGGLQRTDIFSEERGGLDVTFDYSEIRRHYKFICLVYHDPLCRMHASPPRPSVCLSGTKLG